MTDEKLGRLIRELREWLDECGDAAPSGQLFDRIERTTKLKTHASLDRPFEIRKELAILRLELYQRAKAKRAAEYREARIYWTQQLAENRSRVRQTQSDEQPRAKGASA